MEVLFEGLDCVKLQTRLKSLMEYCVAQHGVSGEFMSIDFRVEEDFGYDAEAGIADHADEEWPEDFEITVDPELLKDEEKLFNTIAHEMVHVLQYMDARLVVKGKTFIWNGKVYPTSEKITHAEYYAFPWEIEAYGLEKALYHGFIEHETKINKLLEMVDL